MKSTLDFFEWGFQNLPEGQQIIVAVANSYEKEGEKVSYFSAFNCQTPQKASIIANKYTSQKKDVYYTLNTYTGNVQDMGAREKISRVAKYARMARIIGFDVDCGDGKPYPSWEEALKVAIPVVEELGLDEDEYTTICSGGGLHIYIKLDAFILKDEWIRLTTGLKTYLLGTVLEIDKSKLTDPAMLLRPVGTLNFKKEQPRPVELIKLAPDNVSVKKLEKLLENYLPVRQVELQELLNVEELPASVLDASAFASKEFIKPAFIEVQHGCKQMATLAIDSNVSEALWYAAMGVASGTIDPEAAALAWSKNCATFNHARTLTKLAQWTSKTTGPATCASISQLNPQGCIGCPNAGKIKTPLQSVSSIVTVIKAEQEQIVEFPPTYKLLNGSIYKFNEDLELFVSDYIIYLETVARYYDIRKPVTYLRLQCQIPRVGWVPIEIELNALTGSSARQGEGFPGLMGGIGIALGKKQMGLLQQYILDCYKYYQQHKDIGKVCTQMGWTNDGTFIHGLREYKGTGYIPEAITPQGSSLQVLAKGMVTKGRREDWLGAIRILSKEGMELHAFGYLLAFGSPLFKFSGLDGCTINFYSEHSGSGKTTSPRLAMSVYGSPKILSGGQVDSDAHLSAKLGALNNLPAYSDEMTEMLPQKTSELLYAVSEGQGKGRADRDGEMKETKRWSLIFFMSSNKSMYEKLDMHTKSAAGQKARLIELNLDKNEIMTKYGETINLLIEDNHGHGASEYINQLVTLNKKGDLAMEVRQALKEFEEHFDFTFEGEERFIRNVLACTWYGAKVAIQLGLCPGKDESQSFDLDRIFNSVLRNVKRNRMQLLEAVEDSEEVLNAFIASNSDAFVKVMHEGTKSSGVAPRTRCYGRVELTFRGDYTATTPTSGRISISCEAFKNFCRDTNRPFHKYVNDFRSKFTNYIEMKIDLITGVKYNVDGQAATPIRIKCYNMDLPITSISSFKRNADVPLENDDISFNYGENVG